MYPLTTDEESHFQFVIQLSGTGMPTTSYVVIGLAAVLLISICYVIYVKLSEEKYTRERFAFASLTATTSLLMTAIAQISSAEGLPQRFVAIVLTLVGAPAPTAEPASIAEKLLIALITIFGVIWIDRLNKSTEYWSGQVSVEDYQLRRQHKPRSWVLDGFSEGARLLRRAPPRQTRAEGAQLALQAVLDAPVHNLVWHEHARELVELWASTVRFSTEREGGWNSVEKCWKGRDLATDKHVTLFCYATMPDENLIVQIFDFLHSIPLQGKSRNLLATRDAVEVKTITRGNIEIQIISEAYLLNNIVDFTDYFLEIKRRVERETLPDSGLRIPDVYVQSELTDQDKTARGIFLESQLTRWVIAPPGSQIAILGEYGQGKSTGMLMFDTMQ